MCKIISSVGQGNKIARNGGSVDKALGYWSEGYEFQSQNRQAFMAGPLGKTLNSQLLSLTVSHFG